MQVPLPQLLSGAMAVALSVLLLNSASLDGQGSMFLAPFAASIMLAVSAPDHPSSSPWAIIGGNLVSALCGLVAGAVAAPGPALPLAAGLAFAGMTLLRARHAPAIATAIVCTTQPLGIGYLAYPVFAGAAMIAGLAAAVRQLRRERDDVRAK